MHLSSSFLEKSFTIGKSRTRCFFFRSYSSFAKKEQQHDVFSIVVVLLRKHVKLQFVHTNVLTKYVLD